MLRWLTNEYSIIMKRFISPTMTGKIGFIFMQTKKKLSVQKHVKTTKVKP